jgi:ABC-type multidrug transport system fused ATPase/permease subunit
MMLLPMIRKIAFVLDARGRTQAIALMAVSIVGVVAEIIGVVSIFPFLKCVADPGLVHKSKWFSNLYVIFGFQSENSFLIALGLVSLTMFSFANFYLAIQLWAGLLFSGLQQASISKRLLALTLAKPYVDFIANGSSESSRNILSESIHFCNGTLALIRLVSRAALLALLTTGLFFLDPQIASSSAAIFGGIYGLVFMGVRKRVLKLGRERSEADHRRYKYVYEALASFREIRLRGCSPWATERFEKAAVQAAEAQSMYSTVAEVPRFVIEAVAFSLLVLILAFMVSSGNDIASAFPKLSIMAVASYRLIGSLQQGFGAMSQFTSCQSAIDNIHAAFQKGRLDAEVDDQEHSPELAVESSLILENVTFRYPTSDTPVLDSLNLIIPRKHMVGIIGSTGSGKSTLVGLILGLLRPQKGKLRLGGTELCPANLQVWQQRIGYVPQDVVLLDDSVTRNIAFGVEDALISEQAVRKSAELACLGDFIDSLTLGYQTMLGERGARLSGGQKQRLAIARALYSDPEFLIFDEATSSLDGATEADVMSSVRGLAGSRTVLLIAHRVNTLRDCDVIYFLVGGRLFAQGTYQEISVLPEFLELTRAHNG